MITVLLLLLLISEKNDKLKFITPQFAYIGSFIPALFLLLFYVTKWDVDLQYKTIFLIIGGAVLFLVTSVLTAKIIDQFTLMRITFKIGNFRFFYKNNVCIANWKLWIFILFQFATFVFLYRYAASISGVLSLSAMMYNFRMLSISDEGANIPTVVSIMRLVSISSGYIWIYLLAGSYRKRIVTRTKKRLLIINIILSVLISLMTGGRGNIVEYLVFSIASFYALNFIDRKRINIRFLLTACGILIVCALSFQQLGRLVGRDLTYNNLDYLALYLSAPIKNLDTEIGIRGFSLSEDSSFVELSKNQVFINAINYYAINYGKTSLFHSPYLAFQHINGYQLGNCYTVYYRYLYDGGLRAVCIYVIMMAILCQIVYKIAFRQENRDLIKISKITYFKIYYYAVFSFFDTTFYFNVFSISFIRSFIITCLIKFFIVNMNL